MAIISKQIPERPAQQENRTLGLNHLWKICERCWSVVPTDRPGVGDVLVDLKVGLALLAE